MRMPRGGLENGDGGAGTQSFATAIEAMLVFYAEDVVCHPAPGWADDDVRYTGHDGVRKLAVVWSESVKDAALEVQEVRDLHDRLAILAQLRGRDPRTGEEICQRFGVVNSGLGDDGKVHEASFFMSWEETLAAAAGEKAGSVPLATPI